MPQSLGHHRYKMLAHTIHESKHQPQTHLQHPQPKLLRKTTSKEPNQGSRVFDRGGIRENTHPHPPEKPRQGRGLLPQTPNSAPPGSSRNPGESSILTAIPKSQSKAPSPGPLSSPPA